MANLTVANVLEMPTLRAAGPVVLAGADGVGRTVHWVHTTELVDIAPLLRGGDLILTTGIALPDAPADLSGFASSLANSDAAGLLIELGRRWTVVPTALVAACERLGLPLIALSREARFAAITQAVGERLVDEQLTELREAQRVHETFTELGIAEAGPLDILQAAERLAGAAVVLESEHHQVLDYRAGPTNIIDFLHDWAPRSRNVTHQEHTTWDQANGWLVTRLGRRERRWGRLVIEAPLPPSQRMIAIAERAAAALAMHRLHDRNREGAVRRTHHELVLGLLQNPTDPDLLRRCELAGLPTKSRKLVGVAIRARPISGSTPVVTTTGLDEVIATVVRAAHDLRVAALVCELDRDVRILLSMAPNTREQRLVAQLAANVASHHDVVVGAGRATSRPSETDRTLREAQHVVDSVASGPDGDQRSGVHWLEDVHLRGLLTLLGDDERLNLFVARELRPLREYDERWQAGLLDAIHALLQHPLSKTAAAASLHLSRPAFYERIAKAERVLGADLDNPDARVSLQVALIADRMRQGQDT